MTNRYAKLIDGRLSYAPIKVVVDGCEIHHPNAETLASLGYKPVTDARPEGYYRATGWAETDAAIERVYEEYTPEVDETEEE